ncbi:hypothetical protein GCM10007160_27850 [Litchfieldella qijiaojingensis]|uniref:Uncharacterized protein n=1 Tax=Litchfieldella qijiaojingensis TaxID=980347 RepID=A0ABQ2YZ51_9GAMM|nr:hypothetical protein [Halomonas qijiaojingensis]GGX98643.1 hypothetical protein GCM10007160_27850 [Halomonas qijiaojingensis]
MNIDLDDQTKKELTERIARIEKGERPKEIELAEWIMPIGLCVLISALLVLSL